MNHVSRHYVEVEGRAVHYRVAGRGPLVLLLHQSPQSSADFLDLMDRWANRYTMVAPDRPGCGGSDPLPVVQPSFEDYARATVAFLDAIGLVRVPVYGFHTGASEAIALADQFPERVAAVAANGVAALTPEELADVEVNYLPPFVPSWDGGHLAWLWSRIREQTIFFPWHRRTAAARMRYDVPPPERLQRNVLELLRRSDTYHVAYRAAFCYDARPALQRLRVPVLVTAADWDPLAAHLGRLPQAAPNLALRRAPSAAAAEFLAAEFLAPAAAAPPPLPVPASSGAGGRRLLLGDDYALHAFEWGAADGPQLVLLHDATARAAAVAPLGAALAARGMRVFAPDLPGHGESSSPGALAADVVERCARRLDDALSGRVRGPVALLGVGAGAHVALALAERWRSAVTQVVAHEPHAWPEEDRARIAAAMAVVPAPDWYGGHLQHAWHRSRDAALFHPWCSRRQASALSGEPQLDTAAAHERAVGLLLSGEAGPALAAAAARDDLASRLATAAPRACVSHDERLPSASVNALRAACAPSATRCTAVPAAADAAALADSLSRLLRRVA